MAMEGVNLYNIEYYEKTVFKGSYQGICFRIGKEEVDTAVGDGSSDGAVEGGEVIKRLKVQAWKGPFILEKTKEEVHEKRFEFSEDGLREADEWLESLSEGV